MNTGRGWKHGEIASLTGLRGVAACGVALAHLSGLEILHRQYLWVDFFFLLSGFVLAHAYGRTFIQRKASAVWLFFRARFFRVYPLHVFTLLLMVGWETLKLHAGSHEAFTGYFSILALGAHIGLIQAWPGLPFAMTWNMPAWSISAEMAAYIAFPIDHRLLGDALAGLLLGVIGLVVTVPTAWLTYRFIEVPGRRLGRRPFVGQPD